MDYNIENIKIRTINILSKIYPDYQNLINKRINDLEYVFYNNEEGIREYEQKAEDIIRYTGNLNEFVMSNKIKEIHLLDPSIFNKNIIELSSAKRKFQITNAILGCGFDYLTVLFFSIKPNMYGYIDYLLLHEFCHVISSVQTSSYSYSVGFINSQNENEYNEYLPNKLKYALFDDAIVDIQLEDIIDKMIKSNYYILEPNNNWNNYSNFSTHSYIREIVRPIYNNYKDIIIDSKMTGNFSEFYKIIGSDNFESLINLVNLFENHIRKYTLKKINEEEYNRCYNSSVAKLVKVYKKIGLKHN